MPFDFDQFLGEWRKSEEDGRKAESTNTVQREELRAEMRRCRAATNRAVKRLARMQESLKGVPEALKDIRESSKSVAEMPTKFDGMNRRLTVLAVILALAAFANPVLASEAGKAMVTFLIHKVVGP